MIFVLQTITLLTVIILLSIPLGKYIYKVMLGKRVFLSGVLSPVEKGIFRFLGVREKEQMHANLYITSILIFSLLGIFLLMLIQMTQAWHPFNYQGFGNISWDLALNTAVSFVTNTNWQAYSGEQTLTIVTQATGLTVQNFLSPAVGIVVSFALMRGFITKNGKALGNFWVDMVRVILYILLPLAFVVAIFLVSQGVVQTLLAPQTYMTLESGKEQILILGPVASQIAIKILGTNGGGFFGANAAYPLENPTIITNFIQTVLLLLLPASLCVTFGHAVKKQKEGFAIYFIMLVIFVVALIIAYISEMQYIQNIANVAMQGNMEGKATLHGVSGSILWAIATTAASNGAVNAMHASLTPIASMMSMFLMQLGEIIFGGAGSGLYGMLSFVIITVFIVGLMVGRTPEYLGKKIEPKDIRMVSLMILIPPLMTLAGTALLSIYPYIDTVTHNTDVFRFSEVLYNATSAANNNGSSMMGMHLNTRGINLLSATLMLISRFLPIVACLYLAQNLVQKKNVPVSNGTLSTTSPTFIVTTIIIILVLGALSFLPFLALGPIAESLNMITIGGIF